MRRISSFAVVLAFVGASLVAASPAAAKTLVRYDKSGGIAGIQVSLTVTDAGRATVTRSRPAANRHVKLAAAQLRSLRKALRDARFSTLRSRYAPKTPIADGFTRSIRYAGRSVTVGDGAQLPVRLSRLLERLERLSSG